MLFLAMRPEDLQAQTRFSNIVELFTFLLANHPVLQVFKLQRMREGFRCYGRGSGIAGATLAKALALRKLKVSLTVSDVRPSDLQLVHNLGEVLGYVKSAPPLDRGSTWSSLSVQQREVLFVLVFNSIIYFCFLILLKTG